MSAGRQLVDGVSGARPGRRGEGRRPGLDGLGRWVETKLDWFLEEEEDWREPWQQDRAADLPPAPRRRRPLEAISRRSEALSPRSAAPPAPSDWPDDDAFTLPRWQRQGASPAPRLEAPPPQERPPGRAVPRSTRRRRSD